VVWKIAGKLRSGFCGQQRIQFTVSTGTGARKQSIDNVCLQDCETLVYRNLSELIGPKGMAFDNDDLLEEDHAEDL
jgi:hypothetical protein